MKISLLWRFSLLIFTLSLFCSDTLTLRESIDIAQTSNLNHLSSMKIAQSAFYEQAAAQRRLYPKIDLGVHLPSISYAENDVYLYVDSGPLRNWKKKYGFNGFLRLVQPTFWGGRFIIAPNISLYAERYKLYNPRDLTRQELFFSWRQPLLKDSDERFAYEVEHLDRQFADVELDIKRINLLLELMKAYMNLFVQQRDIVRIRLHAKLVRDFIQDSQMRNDAGEISDDWMFTAKARSMNALSDSIDAENQLRLYREQFMNILNLPFDTMLSTKEPSIAPLEMPDSVLIQRFVENSPDIKKLEIALERERLEFEELRMKKRSNIELNASYSLGGQGQKLEDAMDDFGESEYALSISTTWPILDFGKSSIEIDAKRKQLEAKEIALESKKRMIHAEARIQMDKLHTFEKKYEIHREIALASEKALDAIKNKYTSEDAGLGELIDAFSQFRISMQQVIATKSDYYKTLFRIKLICEIPLDVSTI